MVGYQLGLANSIFFLEQCRVIMVIICVYGYVGALSRFIWFKCLLLETFAESVLWLVCWDVMCWVKRPCGLICQFDLLGFWLIEYRSQISMVWLKVLYYISKIKKIIYPISLCECQRVRSALSKSWVPIMPYRNWGVTPTLPFPLFNSPSPS